ncbi:MAG TPA: SusC/RagA family TonB-linked outer membrane protein [Gemmatimonadales bacterium]|nr:SusC/RagA family TonB-linked outer membrane protein [Gemmatimonadales bacterium]
MSKRALFGGMLVILAATLGARNAAAQARVITGKVTSAQTGQGIARASVSVVGTVIVAQTNDAGEYSLSAPAGQVRLLMRAVGFKRRQVTVTADQPTADVALDQDVFNLEAVVVTGQATAVAQQNLANAVATIAPEALTRAPTPTIESAVQGKIPGALIQSNSGAPGGGSQITLRGVSTINGSVNPLIVVDGMVISNDVIASNMNAVTAAAGGGNASNQDNAVNRLADLNPADVANVEVLKGASAAAIYGSEAANGVIIITTKRGQTGAPRFTMTQRFGQFRLSNKIGQRRFTDSADAVSAFKGHDALVGQICSGGCPFYDFEQELYGQHSLSFETDGSISGGTDQTSYFISALAKRDGGIAPNTGYAKQSLRANLDQLLGSRFHLSVSTQLIHSLADRGISNNDNTSTSPYLVFPFTPSFFNLEPDANGVYPFNPFPGNGSNPLQTLNLLKNAEDVWRVLGTTKLRIDALASGPHHLEFNIIGGLDYYEQQNDILSPPTLYFEPADGQPGTVVLGKGSDQRLNLVGSAIYNFAPASGGYSATTSAGFQYQDSHLNQTNAVGRTILAGQQNINQATTIVVNQGQTPVRSVGLYAQEEVLALDQRLLVTGGIRADRSSVNGDTRKLFIFPKASASYRFLAPVSGVDELKIRGAFGQTGNPPLFGQKFTPEGTGVIGGLFGTVSGANAGSSDIKPERQTEIEGGFDATLGHEFATISFTYYNKTITDLLLVARVAPSTGRTNRIFNGGKLQNLGQEVAVSVSPFRRPDLNWIARVTFSRNRSKVVELPVPAFNTGGFGTSLGAFRIEQGKSATQIVGTEGVVGNSEPKFQMTGSSDFTWKRWNVGMLWDWKKGGDIINLTQLLYDAGSNSADQVPAGNQRIGDWAGGKTKIYVQDGSYLKLRELSFTYDLPESVVGHLFGGVRYARLNVSGRNLIRITPYKGSDPEVSNFGNQAIARNIDVAPFPPSRSFFFSIDLGF